MTALKEMELTVSSKKSWRDALQSLKEASKSLNCINSMYIQNHHAVKVKDKIVAYFITARLSYKQEREAVV
jgi:flavin-binding protein dodecin